MSSQWYRLSAGQGNKNGIENLQALTAKLKAGDGSQWAAANAGTADPAAAQDQRSKRILNLRCHIEELESDARQEEELAAQMQQPAASSGTRAAVMNTLATFGSVCFRVEAEKYRAEAQRLREQLGELEKQNQFSANVANP